MRRKERAPDSAAAGWGGKARTQPTPLARSDQTCIGGCAPRRGFDDAGYFSRRCSFSL